MLYLSRVNFRLINNSLKHLTALQGKHFREYNNKTEKASEPNATSLKSYFKGNQQDILTFEIPGFIITKYIHMGFVHRLISANYCILLAKLAVDETDSILKRKFTQQATSILKYLVESKAELNTPIKANLINSVSSIDKNTCEEIFKSCLDDERMMSYIDFKEFPKSDLLKNCYHYRLIDCADRLINRYPLSVDYDILEIMIEALTKEVCDTPTDIMKDKLSKHLFKVLESIREQRLAFPLALKGHFMSLWKLLGMRVLNNTTISKEGKCENCNHSLQIESPELTTSVHADIKAQLTRKFSYEENMLRHTNQNELSLFFKYIYKTTKKMGPFDLVVDGLNTAYSGQYAVSYQEKSVTVASGGTLKAIKKNFDSKKLEIRLINVMSKLSKKDFRHILLIGRDYMLGWKDLMSFIELKNISCYLPRASSTDDLFVLYAASLNHDTMILSNDFFRDHRESLQNTKAQALLDIWLESRLLRLRVDNIYFPARYTRIVNISKDKSAYHIPFMSAEKPPPSIKHSGFDHRVDWICCQTNK